MRKIIKEIHPDVIIPFVGTVLYVSWLAITGMKIPFVLTIRNNPWTMPEKRLLRNFRDYLAKKSCAILIQNEEQSEYFSARFKKKVLLLFPILFHQSLLIIIKKFIVGKFLK